MAATQRKEPCEATKHDNIPVSCWKEATGLVLSHSHTDPVPVDVEAFRVDVSEPARKLVQQQIQTGWKRKRLPAGVAPGCPDEEEEGFSIV